MYPISSIMADYLRRHDQEFRTKATINGADYTDSKIVDFKVEDRMTLSEGFEIGTAIPSKLTFRLRAAEELPANAQIVPYVALSLASMTWMEANISWDSDPYPWTGGATEWLPLGEFYVDSRDKVNDVWEYICYDKLVYADQPYISSLTYPASQQAVFDEVCGRLGYSYDSSVVINPAYIVPIAPTGFTMRQVLGYIAGANCASLFMGKNGLLKMKRFVPNEQPVFDLGLADYIRARQTNPLKSYTRVVVTYDTEDNLTYESGSGDENHTLTLENPLVTQAMADALCASLSGVSYLPLTMDAKGYPQLEQGDRIGVGLYEGTSWMETITPWMETEIPWTGVVQHQSYILHQVFSFKGGLLMSIESPSISEQKSEFKVPGTLSEAVDNLDKTAVKEGKYYYGTTITRFAGIKVQRSDGKSDLTLNSDVMEWRVDGQTQLYYDALANRIKFSGTLEAADGIFSGDLSAVGGTFTGTLQGVDGIFTGDLEAVGGTFTGTLVGVDGDFSGTITASEFIGGSVVGAIIRTAAAGIYPQVLMDPSSVAFGVYADENNGILIPAYDGGVSKIIFNAGGNQSVLYNSPGAGIILQGFGDATVSGTNVRLNPSGGSIRVPSWSSIINNSGISLQDMFDAIYTALSGKASTSHSHSVTIPNHNHGNPDNLNSGGGTFTVS